MDTNAFKIERQYEFPLATVEVVASAGAQSLYTTVRVKLTRNIPGAQSPGKGWDWTLEDTEAGVFLALREHPDSCTLLQGVRDRIAEVATAHKDWARLHQESAAGMAALAADLQLPATNPDTPEDLVLIKQISEGVTLEIRVLPRRNGYHLRGRLEVPEWLRPVATPPTTSWEVAWSHGGFKARLVCPTPTNTARHIKEWIAAATSAYPEWVALFERRQREAEEIARGLERIQPMEEVQ